MSKPFHLTGEKLSTYTQDQIVKVASLYRLNRNLGVSTMFSACVEGGGMPFSDIEPSISSCWHTMHLIEKTMNLCNGKTKSEFGEWDASILEAFNKPTII